MPRIATGRPGRPAAAERTDALRLATELFLAGERVDVQRIAHELGLARATMHRWFGTRDALLGEALAELAEARMLANRRRVTGAGALALVEAFYAFNCELAGAEGMRAWLEREQDRALRVLTSSAGVVQPRVVATVERMIVDEVDAGAFEPPVAPEILAYTIVRLAESFMYNDAIIGLRGDAERLRQVQAVLLGVKPPQGFDSQRAI
jgi:AcrR family transcriptional regulator